MKKYKAVSRITITRGPGFDENVKEACRDEKMDEVFHSMHPIMGKRHAINPPLLVDSGKTLPPKWPIKRVRLSMEPANQGESSRSYRKEEPIAVSENDADQISSKISSMKRDHAVSS